MRCGCYHAPEQHGPNGCSICICRATGSREDHGFAPKPANTKRCDECKGLPPALHFQCICAKCQEANDRRKRRLADARELLEQFRGYVTVRDWLDESD